jgi:glycosyltransferase involved in cell wall biosynthesis
LDATLLSIDRQSWSNWIHIVVDGGSTDGTVEMIRASIAVEPRRYLVTGKDHGIYDAIFKGFSEVSPLPDDILLWLNADDMLAPWAFITMAAAFEKGADWVTALPARWDEEGRLTHINTAAWYPQVLIRGGWFHGRALGYIQQESTFFARRLFDRVDPAVISHIRSLRYAGDFLLWREFSRCTPLTTLTTMIGGFRFHAANTSSAEDRYLNEIAAEGAPMPPRIVGILLRWSISFFSLIVCTLRARRVSIAEKRRTRG